MLLAFVIQELEYNKIVFGNLLTGVSKEQYTWKPQPDKWCLLEVICHLYDEEREDFRIRLKYVLESSHTKWLSIDPQNWPVTRNYMQQDFEEKIKMFLEERDKSVLWLKSLEKPVLENSYSHPKFGLMSAKMFLSNWLAHDYLHFRQITRIKYEYLKHLSGESLNYAGEW